MIPSPSTALILAGGFGTRLRPVVADRPKALADIRGRPFLAWQLDWLARHGITNIVLCTHYGAAMIAEAFPAGPQANGLTVAHSYEPFPLGTGGALRLALGMVPPAEGIVLAMNGDTLCSFDLDAFVKFHRAANARATLLVCKVQDRSSYGSVLCDEHGGVTAFHEKDENDHQADWVSAGAYILSRDLLETMPAGQPLSIEHDVFPQWTGRGLYAYKDPAAFLDIGTPENYQAALRGSVVTSR